LVTLVNKLKLMKLSTRGRYATRALLDLALHQGEGPSQLKDIAQRQQIPLHYLEHLLSPLIAGGIVRSTRGAKGGVSLARAPEEIKLSQVIRLLEGPLAAAECVDDPGVCRHATFCAAREIWEEIERAMNDILESTTLEDLARRQREKERAEPAMYYL